MGLSVGTFESQGYLGCGGELRAYVMQGPGACNKHGPMGEQSLIKSTFNDQINFCHAISS